MSSIFAQLMYSAEKRQIIWFWGLCLLNQILRPYFLVNLIGWFILQNKECSDQIVNSLILCFFKN